MEIEVAIQHGVQWVPVTFTCWIEGSGVDARWGGTFPIQGDMRLGKTFYKLDGFTGSVVITNVAAGVVEFFGNGLPPGEA